MRKATTETAPEGHIGNPTALVSFILAEFAHRFFCTAIEPRLGGPLSDTPVANESAKPSIVRRDGAVRCFVLTACDVLGVSPVRAPWAP